MSNIKLLNLSLSFLSLLGLIDLVLARPSYAENTQQGCDAQIFPYGDVLFYNNNNNLILSTNNLNNNDSALGNQIGNSYNFSGNPAIPAEEVEQNLGLPLGQLSPDLNFVQATKASAVTLKINPLKNSGCKLLITFLTNDATIIQQGDDQERQAGRADVRPGAVRRRQGRRRLGCRRRDPAFAGGRSLPLRRRLHPLGSQ